MKLNLSICAIAFVRHVAQGQVVDLTKDLTVAADVKVAKPVPILATSDAAEGNEVGTTSVHGIRGAALFPLVKEEYSSRCTTSGNGKGLFGCIKSGCACDDSYESQVESGEYYSGSKKCCFPYMCNYGQGGTGDIYGYWCSIV